MIVHRQLVEAIDIPSVVELHMVLVAKTEEFLLDKPGHTFECNLWFGTPSFLELIISQNED